MRTSQPSAAADGEDPGDADGVGATADGTGCDATPRSARRKRRPLPTARMAGARKAGPGEGITAAGAAEKRPNSCVIRGGPRMVLMLNRQATPPCSSP